MNGTERTTEEASIEERDQLHRSKKKVRNDDGHFLGETSNPPQEENWMQEEREPPMGEGKRSYADTVLHGRGDAY